MDTLNLVFSVLPNIIKLDFILIIALGALLGMFVGAMPGLSSATGLIIILPITFFMPTDHAIGMMVALYMSSLCAGGITAVYFNMPGEPQAAVTAIDGYQMTLKGQHNEAAGLVIGASLLGGFVSYSLLIFLVGPLGKIATRFGPVELFFTALLGMICAAGIKGKDPVKGLVSGSFGFLLGTIGLSPMGTVRATFGVKALMEGVPFLPILIGMLAMSEVFNMVDKETVAPINQTIKKSMKNIFKGVTYCFAKPLSIISGSLIGSIIGAIPAQGATVASFFSYTFAQQYFNKKKDFGAGSPLGVIASETADNASTGGGMLTTLLLGIPGTASNAVLLAALMLHGVQPGPLIIVQHQTLLYTLLTTLFIANIIMAIIAIIVAYYYGSLLFVPTKYLIPAIWVFCTIGAYSARYNIADVVLMTIFAVLGWQMKKRGYVPLAVVVGAIIAPIADAELIRAIQIYDLRIFQVILQSPIALILILLNLLFLINMFRSKKAQNLPIEL